MTIDSIWKNVRNDYTEVHTFLGTIEYEGKRLSAAKQSDKWHITKADALAAPHLLGSYLQKYPIVSFQESVHPPTWANLFFYLFSFAYHWGRLFLMFPQCTCWRWFLSLVWSSHFYLDLKLKVHTTPCKGPLFLQYIYISFLPRLQMETWALCNV